MARPASPPSRAVGLAAWGWGASPVFGIAPFLVAITVLGRAAQNVGQTTYPLEGRELLGMANSTLGIVVAVGGAAGALTAATIGARLTSASAHRLLAIGQALLLAAFVVLALPTAGSGALWAGAILVGISAGLIFPATMTAVGVAAGANPARALAMYGFALSIGLTVGPFLESAILHLLSESLHATFAALLPLPFVATVLATFGAIHARQTRWAEDQAEDQADGGPTGRSVAGAASVDDPGEDRPRPDGPVEDDEAARDLPPLDDGPAVSVPLGERPAGGAGRRRLLLVPAYRLALAVLLTYRTPFTALLAFGGLLAIRADGATSSGVELGFAVFYAVSFFLRAALVRWSPIRRVGLVLSASAVATAVGVALLGVAHSFVLLAVAMGVLGAPHGLTFPLASTILAENIEPRDLGRANARLMASVNIASVGVPLLCGWLAGAVGYRDMFLLVEVPVIVFGTALGVELAGRRRWEARITGQAQALASD